MVFRTLKLSKAIDLELASLHSDSSNMKNLLKIVLDQSSDGVLIVDKQFDSLKLVNDQALKVLLDSSKSDFVDE